MISEITAETLYLYSEVNYKAYIRGIFKYEQFNQG